MPSSTPRGLVRGPHGYRGRRGDAPAQPDRLHAQPPAHGRGELPDKDRHRLAARRGVFRRPPERLRPAANNGGWQWAHRLRRATLVPHLQPVGDAEPRSTTAGGASSGAAGNCGIGRRTDLHAPGKRARRKKWRARAGRDPTSDQARRPPSARRTGAWSGRAPVAIWPALRPGATDRGGWPGVCAPCALDRPDLQRTPKAPAFGAAGLAVRCHQIPTTTQVARRVAALGLPNTSPSRGRTGTAAEAVSRPRPTAAFQDELDARRRSDVAVAVVDAGSTRSTQPGCG